MANICTNRLYLSTGNEELRDALVESIRQTFDCNDVHSFNGEVSESEIEFDSGWTFPHREMEELTKELPQENDLYIRVLSYEFGCEYVGLNVYASGEWHDKFAG
jgi:hypothetical protein